jgi:hypothetical protein
VSGLIFGIPAKKEEMTDLYPKLIIGEQAIAGYLPRANDIDVRFYECAHIDELRSAVAELLYLSQKPFDVFIHLSNPTRAQYNALLKFLEESQLRLVLLVPKDNVPDTVVSRCPCMEKDVGNLGFVAPNALRDVSKSVYRKVRRLRYSKEARGA